MKIINTDLINIEYKWRNRGYNVVLSICIIGAYVDMTLKCRRLLCFHYESYDEIAITLLTVWNKIRMQLQRKLTKKWDVVSFKRIDIFNI